MGYSESLEAAGAKVLAYEMFGSYQGDWAALVEYKGQKGIAFGSYGSCSGCDAFEAEFNDYHNAIFEQDGKYYNSWYDDDDNEITKEDYDAKKIDKEKRLAEFGTYYLNELSDEQIIEVRLSNLEEDDWFSDEKKEMLNWCLAQLSKI